MAGHRYGLTKRWRLGEWHDPESKETVGIYVTHDGTFYARMPEAADGELFRAPSRAELEVLLREQAPRIFALRWEKVIRVTLVEPMRGSDTATFSYWTSLKWDPSDPDTAGERVQLTFVRLEVARSPKGDWVWREWPDDFGRRRISVDGFSPEPGVRVQLPYSERTWQALEDARDKIRRLNHALRHLLSSDDFEQRLLLSLSASRLLLTGEPEPDVPDEEP